MTFVQGFTRGKALIAARRAARGVARDAVAGEGRSGAAQRLSRHQRQSQSRARDLLSGHRRRAGAIVDQHSRVPCGLRLVRGGLRGQSRLDALDLSAGMVPGPLLFAARLRTAPRLSRRRLRR